MKCRECDNETSPNAANEDLCEPCDDAQQLINPEEHDSPGCVMCGNIRAGLAYLNDEIIAAQASS